MQVEVLGRDDGVVVLVLAARGTRIPVLATGTGTWVVQSLDRSAVATARKKSQSRSLKQKLSSSKVGQAHAQ